MAILGAHRSIAGGFDKAVERARLCGCDCLQLFTKNNNQWAGGDIAADEARRFSRGMDTFGGNHPLAHDSYLINLASPAPLLWRKSVDAFVAELHRAEILGIPYVVTHPGAFTTATRRRACGTSSRALDEVADRTSDLKARCLLETTAGQGTALGWRFEHFAAILDGVRSSPTAWGSASTPATSSPPATRWGRRRSTRRRWRRSTGCVGVDRIKAFHLNDSRRELGSRIDRHEHIGRGRMGLEPFRLLLADPRFRETPMYLETPKGEENGEEMDVINLRVLRGCIDR